MFQILDNNYLFRVVSFIANSTINSRRPLLEKSDNMIWAFSSLKAEQIKSIKELEEKMGVTLLAFSGINIKYADLSEEDLKLLLQAEKDLGVSLVAVNVE